MDDIGNRQGRMRASCTRLVITTLVALTLGLGLAAQASARPHGGCGHRSGEDPGGLEQRIEELELSAETGDAVEKLLDQTRAQQRELRGQLRENHERMHDLLAQESAPAQEILALADTIGALETHLHKNRLQTLLQIRSLLTPEQWQELLPQHERGRRFDRNEDEEGD